MGRMAMREFGGGGEGVAADRHGGRSGVGFLTCEGDGPALDAFGSQDDTERELKGFEDRALFDVEFEVGFSVRAFSGR